MSSNRRLFLKSLGTLAVSSTILKTQASDSFTQTDIFNFKTESYLQNFTKDTISILSIVSKPALAWLEILHEDNSIKETIYQTEDGMRNANATLFKFKVRHQSQNFKYRVVAKEILKFEAYNIEYGQTITSATYQTELPFIKDNKAHLLILNDIHENKNTYKDLYEKSTLPRKDLVVLNGDTFHYVTTENDIIDKLLKPITKTFAEHTPFIMVRGNHETRGAFSRDYKKYFDYPENKYYYAFSVGSLFVIILDAGEDKPDTHEVYANTVDYDNYRLEQKEWLSKVLKSKEKTKAKHTIIINHIPWLHSDEWHGTQHNKLCFHELTQNNKVDAVISGHTHRYAFHPPNEMHNYHVIIGGGPKEGNRTFIEIIADNKKLHIALKKDDGSLIDSYNK